MLVAIDTGGTKTLITSFKKDGTPTEEFRFATPRKEGEYIKTVTNVLNAHFSTEEIDAVVVAAPGIVKNNIAKWCGHLGWENFDIAAHLKPFTNAPIFLENDANLAGLAETKALDTPSSLVLYITISTGIGTGIIVDGAIHPALSSSEGGHAILEHDGALQEWETFASGKSIRETYGAFARDIHDTDTWDEIADKISRGFLALIPLLQPEVIIIGGSIGTFYAQYKDRLDELLRDQLSHHLTFPRIQQAKHPEEAVIYGCYYYGTDQLSRR